MGAGVLLQYIGIPTVLFTIQSLFKVPILETLSKHKNLSGALYVTLPIILSFITVYVFKYKGSNYIDESSDSEKIMETFMSESAEARTCDESQNKYKYAVADRNKYISIISVKY